MKNFPSLKNSMNPTLKNANKACKKRTKKVQNHKYLSENNTKKQYTVTVQYYENKYMQQRLI